MARNRLKIVRAEQKADEAKKAVHESTKPPTLLEYFSIVSPDLERPDWLAPYAEELQRAIGSELRLAFAAPPQHGKTELAFRALLYWAQYFPGYRHCYVTYNDERATQAAKDFREIALDAGFAVTGTLDVIILNGTTKIKFTSIGGSLTGYPIDGVCIIDDPFKDAKDARSRAIRRNVIDWYKSTARTRRHAGTSFIIMATRWHTEDLTGHVVKHERYQYINLKAIAEERAANDNADAEGRSSDLDADGRIISDPLHRRPGESLWPARKPPEFFEEERRDKYWWSAMYQGEPRPPGGNVFNPPNSIDDEGKESGARYYRELPTVGYRVAFGLDLAYSKKTKANWSVLVEGWACGGFLYIVDVIRKQVDAPAFGLTLKAKSTQRPGAKMRWYQGGGGEKGSADFLKRMGLPIRALPARGDKFVRATPAAAKWNRGEVLLPDPQYIDAPWHDEFVSVVCDFTGDDDAVDDDVDALAGLHDELFRTNPMVDALKKHIGKET